MEPRARSRDRLALWALALAVTLAGCDSGIPPAGNYATVFGRVTDAKTGAAVTNATVVVDGLPAVQTDADGNYKVTTVPTGPWSYSAQAAAYRRAGNDEPAPLKPGEQRNFAIVLTHQ